MMRSISPAGLDFIKSFEGLELEAYQDIAGVWTIGYGHTSKALSDACNLGTSGGSVAEFINPGQVVTITKENAELLLLHDLRPRMSAVHKLVIVPLNQNEFDALVCLVYNIGRTAFSNSTALRRLNRGDRAGCAEAMLWFNKARVKGKLREVRGLTRRRNAEVALFQTPMPEKQLPKPESNVRPAFESRPGRFQFPPFIAECFR